jgi:hypothetical protein
MRHGAVVPQGVIVEFKKESFHVVVKNVISPK